LRITTESLPTATGGAAYATSVQAEGGVTPYRWATGVREVRSPAQPLSTGVAQGWRGDDEVWQYTLPFSFSYFGRSYGTVNVCSNGYLDFTDAEAASENSAEALAAKVRVAGFWIDLLTNGPTQEGEDIYVSSDEATYVTFRWRAETYVSGRAVDFEITLRAGGGIEMRYGAMALDRAPTVGLGAGDGVGFRSVFDGGRGFAAGDGVVVSSQLPEGLSLDDATGRVSGTPQYYGTYPVEFLVRDGAGAVARKVLPLTVEPGDLPPTASTTTTTTTTTTSTTSTTTTTLPLSIVTEALPGGTVGVEYSTALQATGGTAPYGKWHAGLREVISEAQGVAGGVAQGWNADDACWSCPLPFAFPYYGRTYTSVYVCSNGYLDFGDGAADYAHSGSGLAAATRIAGFWADLVTNGAAQEGEDIYVRTDGQTYVAFRWRAESYYDAAPVNFEIVLHRDGRIEFAYGSGNAGIWPTIGVSAGNGADCILSVRDGSADLDDACGALWKSQLPDGLTLDAATGVVAGTPEEDGEFTVALGVCDAAEATARRALTLIVDAPMMGMMGGFSSMGFSLQSFVFGGGSVTVTPPSAVSAWNANYGESYPTYSASNVRKFASDGPQEYYTVWAVHKPIEFVARCAAEWAPGHNVYFTALPPGVGQAPGGNDPSCAQTAGACSTPGQYTLAAVCEGQVDDELFHHGEGARSITVVDIDRVEVLVDGKTPESLGGVYYIAASGQGDVTVRLVLTGGVSGRDLRPGFVAWAGGVGAPPIQPASAWATSPYRDRDDKGHGVADNQLEWKIPRSAAGYHPVSVLLGWGWPHWRLAARIVIVELQIEVPGATAIRDHPDQPPKAYWTVVSKDADGEPIGPRFDADGNILAGYGGFLAITAHLNPGWSDASIPPGFVEWKDARVDKFKDADGGILHSQLLADVLTAKPATYNVTCRIGPIEKRVVIDVKEGKWIEDMTSRGLKRRRWTVRGPATIGQLAKRLILDKAESGLWLRDADDNGIALDSQLTDGATYSVPNTVHIVTGKYTSAGSTSVFATWDGWIAGWKPFYENLGYAVVPTPTGAADTLRNTLRSWDIICFIYAGHGAQFGMLCPSSGQVVSPQKLTRFRIPVMVLLACYSVERSPTATGFVESAWIENVSKGGSLTGYRDYVDGWSVNNSVTIKQAQ
jgi:hypothetical protein